MVTAALGLRDPDDGDNARLAVECVREEAGELEEGAESACDVFGLEAQVGSRMVQLLSLLLLLLLFLLFLLLRFFFFLQF